MTILRTPPAELLVPQNDDPSVKPVSASRDPIEGRIADEMTATLKDWLHRLPARFLRRRRGNGQHRADRR